MNIISIDDSLENLEYQCSIHDFFYQYSDDHRKWSEGHDRYKLITRILEDNNYKLEAIKIFNEHAPEQFQMPLESKYYFKREKK